MADIPAIMKMSAGVTTKNAFAAPKPNIRDRP
jgi:hypothetical protein